MASGSTTRAEQPVRNRGVVRNQRMGDSRCNDPPVSHALGRRHQADAAGPDPPARATGDHPGRRAAANDGRGRAREPPGRDRSEKLLSPVIWNPRNGYSSAIRWFKRWRSCWKRGIHGGSAESGSSRHWLQRDACSHRSSGDQPSHSCGRLGIARNSGSLCSRVAPTCCAAAAIQASANERE